MSNRDLARNVGESVGNRLYRGINSALNDSATASDRSVPKVRAGLQQRYNSLQMENVVDNDYAMFDSVWGSSLIVAP